MSKPLLGLTGGIGCGKSTVAAMLARQGAHIIDADAIAHASTAANGAAIADIAAEFGPGVLTEQGALNRGVMRELVFSDPQAKLRLQAIIHPRVAEEIQRQSQAASLAACVIVDIPLLVESGHWRAALRRVLVVDCSPATQIARVCQRNGFSPDMAQKIMAAQCSRSQRLAAADLIICNDGINLHDLEALVRQIGEQFEL